MTCASSGGVLHPCCRAIAPYSIYIVRRRHIILCKRAADFADATGSGLRLERQRSPARCAIQRIEAGLRKTSTWGMEHQVKDLESFAAGTWNLGREWEAATGRFRSQLTDWLFFVRTRRDCIDKSLATAVVFLTKRPNWRTAWDQRPPGKGSEWHDRARRQSNWRHRRR